MKEYYPNSYQILYDSIIWMHALISDPGKLCTCGGLYYCKAAASEFHPITHKVSSFPSLTKVKSLD